MLKHWFLCIFMCFSLVAHADQTVDLYRIMVPVEDQTTKSREVGIDNAFSKMLVKITGNSRILQSPQLKPFLTDPKAFLDSVGFSQLSNAISDDSVATLLDVRFDRPSVDKLLKQAQLPIIPAIRPKFLVWLLVDDIDQGRRVVHESMAQQVHSSDYLSELINAFDQSMQARAVSYFFPSYDLEDQLSLSLNEAWSLEKDPIESASQRYAADGWFAIRVFKASNGQIRGALAYQHAGKRQMDDFHGDDLGDLIELSVNQIMDIMLQSYTYVPQLETDKLLVQIDGVGSFKNYQAVMKQLEQLELVEALQLYSVNRGELVVAIDINGRADLLHAELLGTGIVTPHLSSDNRSIGRLTYRWAGQ